MTLYSCLPGQGKVTVLATWAGEFAESYSVKVTTITERAEAAHLADELTRVSESLWDAAAWLDIYDEAEAALAAVIDAARASADVPVSGDLDFSGHRHGKSWTGQDLAPRLGVHLPQMLSELTRAQRLSVADELETDAAARAASLKLLASGFDPDESDSRIWQAAAITRVTQMGLPGPLPDGAAGWMVRVFDTDRSPAERWGARNLLHRLEQLAAAAKTVNGRGGTDIDPLLDHLVLPAELFGVHIAHAAGAKATVDDAVDAAVAGSALADAYRGWAANAEFVDGDAALYIAPDIDMRATPAWERDPFAKLSVVLRVWRDEFTLATLDPTDTAGFVAALGSWVTRTVYRC